MTSTDQAERSDHVCAGCASGLSRRRVLVGGAALLGAGVLAACGADGGAGGSSGGQEGSAAPSDGGASDGGAEGLVALADVPVGGAVLVRASSGEVVVAQPQEGSAVAFSAVCTHQGCIVEVEGAELVCPCHGSVFEAVTGAYVSGPAPRGLDEVAVEVRDGQVVEA